MEMKTNIPYRHGYGCSISKTGLHTSWNWGKCKEVIVPVVLQNRTACLRT